MRHEKLKDIDFESVKVKAVNEFKLPVNAGVQVI